MDHSMIKKGMKVKGFAKVVQRYVEGEVYYIFSNGLGVLTPGGIVMMEDGEWEMMHPVFSYNKYTDKEYYMGWR